MKENTTSIHLRVKYEDWIVTEDRITEYIEAARKEVSDALSVPVENVTVDKIIQENPIWIDPNIEGAEA